MLSTHCKLTPIAIVCAVLCHSAALADELILPTVLVTSTRSTLPDANRLGVGTQDTPQAITSITGEMMRAQGVDSLDDVMLNVPGITQTAGHSGLFSNYVARGFQLDNASNYFRDGLRFDRQSQISLQNIEQVEVIRGPASLQFGKLIPGGLVNFVTKKPTATRKNEVTLYANRFGQVEGGLDSSGKLDAKGNVTYRLNAEAKRIGSFRDHVDGDAFFVAPALTFALSEATVLDVMIEHQRHDSLRDPGQPAPDARDLASVTRIDPAAFFGEPNATNEVRNTSGALRLNHRLNDAWQLRADYSGSRFDRDMNFTINMNRRPATPALVPRLSRAAFTHADADSVRFETFGDFATGAVGHKLLAGVDRLERRVDELTTGNTVLAPVDLFQPVPSGNATYSATPLFSDQLRGADTGFYLQDQMSAGAWSVMLGLRHDRLKETHHDRMLDFRNQHNATQTSPSAGLVYHLVPQVSLYASYSRSLDSNLATNGCGRSYDPSRGAQYEVGAKGSMAGGLQWAVSGFDLTRSNGLSEDPSGAVDPDDNSCLVQGAQQRSSGIEIEASGRITKQVRLLGAFTRMNARFTEDTDPSRIGKKLRNAPKQSARLWAEYHAGGALPGLTASLGLTHVGARFANDANTLEIAAYSVWDAGVRYAFGKSDTVQLTVSNLGDRRYVEDSQANANGINQGAPRNVAVRYTHQF
ncbi:TonB-dependent siderophore receptor [Massilia sp. CCM 8695]|uniref:TonB-dependent siderophore receptor n=1 Tax=Massilia frigida TaxID=2609281 RepID=A0ABX0NCS9_9BURK|nr:TonB-dependent siderophore receptor [Massilia frigida]NHZ80286.1 TonB-dependent siderophore receptor [Massilia frigida]